MPRGIPWDDLSLTREVKPDNVEIVPKEVEITPEKRDFMKDLEKIGRRGAFGLVTGAITGSTFGAVEVMRDTKTMLATKSVATAKVARFAGLFGGFFGSYHAVRKAFALYNPQPPETNTFLAAACCITPLVAISQFRPLIPYSVLLIGLDAMNGLDDI